MLLEQMPQRLERLPKSQRARGVMAAQEAGALTQRLARLWSRSVLAPSPNPPLPLHPNMEVLAESPL